MTNLKKLACILSIVVVFLILIIVLLEFNVAVCKVVSSDDISKIYNGILEANPGSDVTIIRRQVSTEGTAYRVEASTNGELIGENRDVVLQNWIDPRYLSINNNFTMDGAVELIVVSKAKTELKRTVVGGESVPTITPTDVTMVTGSQKIVEFAQNGEFKLKDMSRAGHMRFYLGGIIPLLRWSV